ncbi:hypothetical protein ACI3L8_23325 [Vibrio campbellii]
MRIKDILDSRLVLSFWYILDSRLVLSFWYNLDYCLSLLSKISAR